MHFENLESQVDEAYYKPAVIVPSEPRADSHTVSCMLDVLVVIDTLELKSSAVFLVKVDVVH